MARFFFEQRTNEVSKPAAAELNFHTFNQLRSRKSGRLEGSHPNLRLSGSDSELCDLSAGHRLVSNAETIVKHKLSASRVVNIADLRRLAERRVPKVVFDYLDGGAGGEITLRENCQAFEEVTFRPRHAV